VAALVGIGAAWGITQPFAKIAVSEGYRHFGIIFWQFALGGALLAAVNAVRGKGLPIERRHVTFYAIIALIGTLLPNSAGYTAAIHLPSGILSIVLSLVPMMSFPIALALGMDRFSALRFLGLCLGLCAILLIALPETSLPDRLHGLVAAGGPDRARLLRGGGQFRRQPRHGGAGPGAGAARRLHRRRRSWRCRWRF
jgi:drug/metabolite transporter (DMT)-like permease